MTINIDLKTQIDNEGISFEDFYKIRSENSVLNKSSVAKDGMVGFFTLMTILHIQEDLEKKMSHMND